MDSYAEHSRAITNIHASEADPGMRPDRDWPWLATILIISVLSAIPVRHDLRWIGDEGIWLRAATEILGGRIPYRDFFEFQGPLGFYVVAGWLGVFGQTLEAARGLTATLATLTSFAIFMLCRRVSQSPRIAAFLALIWLMATQGDSAELTHHSITTLLSLCAMWFTLSGRPFLAGVASGGAGMVTQTRGVFCAVAALASNARHYTALQRFFVGLAVVPGAFGLYLLANRAALSAWRDMVVWPLTSYSDIQGLPFGHAWDERSIWAPIIYLLIAGGAMLLSRRWRNDPAYRASLTFASAGLLGSFPRPDAIHLAWTLPLALPLAALVVAHLGKRFARRWMFACIAVAFAFASVSLGNFILRLNALAQRPKTATLGGEVAFREADVSELVRHVQGLPANDRIFFYPYMAMVPFLTRREQVGNYDIFLPYYTTRTQYEDAAEDVAQQATWVVYDRRDSDPRHMREIYPRMPEAMPPEYGAMETLLGRRFKTVWSNKRFEIRRLLPRPQT